MGIQETPLLSSPRRSSDEKFWHVYQDARARCEDAIILFKQEADFSFIPQDLIWPHMRKVG